MPDINEQQTRVQLIDKALARAGWHVANPNQVGIEVPVDDFEPEAWPALNRQLRTLREAGVTYEARLPTGISDYVLKRPNGEIIAVVEAKRTSIDPRLAQVQTEFYVREIEKRQSFRPFAFMTNGHEIYFWDVGRANKRLVHGFFTPRDLESQLYIRQNKKSLLQTEINQSITDRLYQQEAIRRVCQAFEVDKKRMALIVMATGTGKTRTAMSIIDVFMRSNQAQRVLFVADRDALVKQALEEGFQTHLPDEPCDRIVTHRIDKTKRLFAVTLQTLSNCFQRFSPAFFDLIIFDEVHRSIFNKWYEVIEYFDGRMIGLTATPAGFIDRNTFRVFQCDGEMPTVLYSYERAVEEGFLVNYVPYTARTRFQRQGIKGIDLDEEAKNALIEQGIDPDELDFEGTDLERTVSNRDTLVKQWQEFMDVCYKDQSGQLPGKTILFAMTQKHALRLAKVFEEMFPNFPGLVQVITHKAEHKGTAIKKFKSSNMPRIAISVDMLDTGVNVPEVVNLVFMKPVHSYIKLIQMIGRGTRNHAACKHPEWLPGGEKTDFLIIDFWENDLNKDPQQEQEAQNLPVLVSTFNTRLKLLETMLSDQQGADFQQVIADLRDQIATIPLEAFSVKRVYHEIEEAWQDAFWTYLTPSKIAFLRLQVAPLLRYVPDVDVQAATFTGKVERLKLQRLTGKNTAVTIESIREDVSRLPDFVRQNPQRQEAIRRCLSTEIETADPAALSQIITLLAGQMRHRRDRVNPFLELDLPDFMEMRSYIFFYDRGQPIYVDEYRRRVEDKVLDVIASHPVIARIERGEAVGDDQLLALERTLREALSGEDIQLNEDNIRRAYGVRVDSFMAFVRNLLELDGIPDYADLVARQFQEFVGRNQFNADQIRFLRAVQSVFLHKRRLALHDLYEAAPLRAFGKDAVDRFFDEAQRQKLLEFANALET
jgi:type I restriction enzyme, R subunit